MTSSSTQPNGASVRATALRLLTATRVADLCRPFVRRSAVIFAFHRFANPDLGVPGFSPDLLRTLLEHLRRTRHPVVSLREAVARLRGQGPPLRGAVTFTIDDGYRDQVEVAAPIFAEFDYPATTFVVSGFLDGDMWLWWDQVDFLLSQTPRPQLAWETPTGERILELSTPAQAQAAREVLARDCRTMTPEAIAKMLETLAQAAEVELPTRPPARFAPMSWDALRAAERSGMTFGPHTVTHPILSRVGDERSRAELEVSWRRLRAEAASPDPVFAYPNGKPPDFGPREIGTLRELGLEAACTCFMTYATPRRFRRADGPFLLPRFAPPGSVPELSQFVTGVEQLKQWVRGDQGV